MKIAYLISLIASSLWYSGIFAAPYFKALGRDTSFIYYIYSFVCHQDPARSFFLMGNQLAVCSRCTGIYSGAFLFILFSPVWKPKLSKKNVIILAIPLIAGKLMEWIVGFSSNIERFITGFPFGILVGMGFLYGISSLLGGSHEG